MTDVRTVCATLMDCLVPLLKCLDQYSSIGRVDGDLFESVLRTRVRREESRASGLYECAFYFAL